MESGLTEIDRPLAAMCFLVCICTEKQNQVSTQWPLVSVVIRTIPHQLHLFHPFVLQSWDFCSHWPRADLSKGHLCYLIFPGKQMIATIVKAKLPTWPCLNHDLVAFSNCLKPEPGPTRALDATWWNKWNNIQSSGISCAHKLPLILHLLSHFTTMD